MMAGKRNNLIERLEKYRDHVFHDHESAVMTLVEDGSHVLDIRQMLDDACAALRVQASPAEPAEPQEE